MCMHFVIYIFDGKFFCSWKKDDEKENISHYVSSTSHSVCYQVIARLANCKSTHTNGNLWLIFKMSYFNDILHQLNSGSVQTKHEILDLSFVAVRTPNHIGLHWWLQHSQETQSNACASRACTIHAENHVFHSLFSALLSLSLWSKAKYVPFLQLHFSRNNSTTVNYTLYFEAFFTCFFLPYESRKIKLFFIFIFKEIIMCSRR